MSKDYYERVGDIRYALAHLAGRLDASVMVPECAMSLKEVQEALTPIRANVAELHDSLILVGCKDD